MSMFLVKYRLGRIMLHVVCMCIDGKVKWHLTNLN
jgi:hypothetical protein